MIIRTEAIVLRSMDYRETSRIVTLFTRDKGKIAVLARGARLPKSRFGATLQPMSFTQVVFYHKPTRSLQTLTESAHVALFTTLGRSLDRITVGLRLVELVQALMQDEEQNGAVFNLLLQALERLNTAAHHTANVLPYFHLRLAAALGFAPAIEREAVEGLPAEGGLLALDSGAVCTLAAHLSHARRASRSALRAYAICARADLDTVMRMHLPPPLLQEVNQLAEAYLRYHVEESYPTRSDAVIGQLKKP